MGRPKKQNREPFWRSERNCWYVQNGSTQVRLSPEKDEAWRLWHEFMARKRPVRVVRDALAARALSRPSVRGEDAAYRGSANPQPLCNL